MKFDIGVFFEKSVKFQVSLKYDKTDGTYRENQRTFLIISPSIRLRMRNVSDKVIRKVESHILCSKTFFFLENFTFMRKCGKILHSRAATDDKMMHEHCILDT